MEGNRDGVWDWNAVTNEVFFSRRWKEMIGYDDGEIRNELSEWDERIHPDDRAHVYAELERYVWILDRGKVVSWTDDGRPLRVVGTHSDVTERRERDAETRRLLDELQAALARVKQLRVRESFRPGRSRKPRRPGDGGWNPRRYDGFRSAGGFVPPRRSRALDLFTGSRCSLADRCRVQAHPRRARGVAARRGVHPQPLGGRLQPRDLQPERTAALWRLPR